MDRTCLKCGGALTGRQRMWCSDRCKQAAFRGRELPEVRTTCKGCDGPLPRSKGPKPRTWCSEACRWTYQHATRKEHERAYGRQRYADNAEVLKAQAKAFRERHAEYHQAYRKRNRERIAARGKAWRAANPERVRTKARIHSRRRRELKLGAASDRVTIDELLTDQANKCGLCGRRINVKLRWPDPGSPSIDHIVPVSVGGSGLRANLQAAHLRCNQSKQHRVFGLGEQLRIV